MCTASIVTSENVNFFSRNFYFGDKDGDRIFTSFTGNPLKNARENVIIAGTGKYIGTSGKGAWDCDAAKIGDHSAFNSRQTITYKIN